jgi:hypothetical protein
MRIGLHGRNAEWWNESDFRAIERADIETLVMMSFTSKETFERLRQQSGGNIEFIVRLYDDRLRNWNVVEPQQFASKVVPQIKRVRPHATKFQIHNEPNHVTGLEGWGASDEGAKSFNEWYKMTYAILSDAAPWASFGFPGLALNWPHRDMRWLELCKDSIKMSAWLGCHCYWQYDNMLDVNWGRRYTRYHERFPNKRIEITEFGNSTPNLAPHTMASEYVQYYSALRRDQYLGSASAFIASSPDPQWEPFVWVKESGEMMHAVYAVGDMPRPAIKIPHIVNITDKLPKHPDPEEPYGTRRLKRIKDIVIHHSAVPPHVGARRIANYHIGHWGWEGIGYHYVITANGNIYQTNNLTTISNHAYEINGRSVGICLLGSFMPNANVIPTQQQIAALKELCDYLRVLLDLGPEAIMGHKESIYSKTACPGRSWAVVKQQII